MDNEAYVERLVAMMKAADRGGATELVEGILAEGFTPVDLMEKVLDPALVQVGRLWGGEMISLSQSFVAAKIAEDILVRCTPDGEGFKRSAKGPVVLGNIEDDFHGLGRRIVSSFLTASGWTVHDLGNDVVADELLNKAVEVGAPVIGVSAMMQTTALNIRNLRELMDRRGVSGKIKLAVGGAVFNWRPELVKEVGGDGTAANAAGADELFMKLKAETEKQ